MKVFSAIKKSGYKGEVLDNYVSNSLDHQTRLDWAATGVIDVKRMKQDIILFVKQLNKKLPDGRKGEVFNPTPIVNHAKYHSLHFDNGEFVLSPKKLK